MTDEAMSPLRRRMIDNLCRLMAWRRATLEPLDDEHAAADQR